MAKIDEKLCEAMEREEREEEDASGGRGEAEQSESESDDDDVAAPAAPAAPARDLATALAISGWTDQSTDRRFYFYQGETRRLTVFPLSGLKAVCDVHPRCQCWLSERTIAHMTESGKQPLAELLFWGIDGPTVSEQEHYNRSQALRRSAGMKIR